MKVNKPKLVALAAAVALCGVVSTSHAGAFEDQKCNMCHKDGGAAPAPAALKTLAAGKDAAWLKGILTQATPTSTAKAPHKKKFELDDATLAALLAGF